MERPASVIKELVENSLDAGATEIEVEIERGGRRLIRVWDNGRGMDHDECLLAVERHATSKIKDETDLLSITTLGFRGEALPSIAAVSRFRLTSKTRDGDAGNRITLDGGVLKGIEEAGCPDGTCVEVKDLFYNTPARRRFLRGIETEKGHIIDVMTRIALSRPDVRFVLKHNGRAVFTLGVAEDRLIRVSALLGNDVHKAMLPVEFRSDDIEVVGGVAKPGINRATAKHIYMLVNDRPVKDRVTTSAVIEGFRDHLMKGRYPTAVLWLYVPPDMIDVNVHPAKTEVRFRDSRSVHQAVSAAVRRALENETPGDMEAFPGETEHGSRVADAIARFSRGSSGHPTATVHGGGMRDFAGAAGVDQGQEALPSADRPGVPWRVIGQVLKTYILAEGPEGLVIIDQHAAHERVVYEELLRQLETGGAQSQALLLPITLDMSGSEAEALDCFCSELDEFGMTVERFGPKTFVIKSLPALVPESEATELVHDVVEGILESGSAGRLADQRDKVVERIACHGAIRAGSELSHEAMRRLISDLMKTGNPEHCPHGRPTIIRLSGPELERIFKRT